MSLIAHLPLYSALHNTVLKSAQCSLLVIALPQHIAGWYVENVDRDYLFDEPMFKL